MANKKLNRKEFMQRTGIYITPKYFEVTKKSFENSGLTVDEYIDKINDPNQDYETVQIPLSGTLKCFYNNDEITDITGEKEPEDRTALEIIDDLATRIYELEVLKDKRGELNGIAIQMMKSLGDIINILSNEYQYNIARNEPLRNKLSPIWTEFERNMLEFSKIGEIDLVNKIITPEIYFSSEWMMEDKPMTKKTKELFTNIVSYLVEEGVTNPVEMIAPIIYNLNQTQFQTFRGHIESSNEYQLCYRNLSGGYNDGKLTIEFMFPSAKSKTYEFAFSSVLKGNYCIGKDDEEPNPEWWNPSVDIIVSESIGVTTWNGDKKDLKKYVDELTKSLSGENEIVKLKQEIAEKQRELAKLTA